MYVSKELYSMRERATHHFWNSISITITKPINSLLISTFIHGPTNHPPRLPWLIVAYILLFAADADDGGDDDDDDGLLGVNIIPRSSVTEIRHTQCGGREATPRMWTAGRQN